MPSQSHICSIIVTYNASPWINKCLNSLLNGSVKTDIVVVDNNSRDSTVELVQEYKTVKLIQNNKNIGFGQANNIGFEWALKNRAKYVFLLNQDAWVEQNTIEELVKIAELNLDYGVISPFHFNASKDKIDYNFFQFTSENSDESRKMYSDIFLGNHKKTPYNIDFINAAAWLVPCRCLKKVGGFSKLFHHYGEDENFISRVKFHKFKVGVVPSTIIFHDRENRWESVNDLSESCEEKKRYLLLRLTDPEVHEVRKALNEIFYLIYESMKYLATVKFSKVWCNYKLVIFIISNINRIIRHNKYCKEADLPFLQEKLILSNV